MFAIAVSLALFVERAAPGEALVAGKPGGATCDRCLGDMNGGRDAALVASAAA